MTDSAALESRAYRHRACGSETVVSGQPFELVSNPLSSIERTFCAECEEMFGIGEFEWTDTGETIADYYARHSQQATPAQRFLVSKTFMIALILALAVPAAVVCFGVMKGSWLTRIIGIVGGLGIGGFAGMVVFVELFAKPITRKVCQVSDTRCLR